VINCIILPGYNRNFSDKITQDPGYFLEKKRESKEKKEEERRCCVGVFSE